MPRMCRIKEDANQGSKPQCEPDPQHILSQVAGKRWASQQPDGGNCGSNPDPRNQIPSPTVKSYLFWWRIAPPLMVVKTFPILHQIIHPPVEFSHRKVLFFSQRDFNPRRYLELSRAIGFLGLARTKLSAPLAALLQKTSVLLITEG